MSNALDSKTPKGPKAPTLYLIAGFKLSKAIALIAVGAGIFALSGRDLGDVFDNFLRWVRIDPSYRFFANISERLDTFTPANLKTFASGTMIYGCFLLASGIGLASRAKWAIWLCIGESAFFIPIEIFGIVNPHKRPPVDPIHPVDHSPMMAHPTLGLIAVLIVNVIIVVYLYQNRNRLFRHHQ